MSKTSGFQYSKTPLRFVMNYKDGKWDDGHLSSDETIVLNERACVLQYGQSVFEGLKAYKTKNGKIVCFRPDLNAKRLADSCIRMKMPPVSEEKFLEAIKDVVLANKDLIPSYGEGGSLYLRPFVIGTNPVLGVKPASEYQFRVFACPVSSYFNGETKPLNLRVSDLDRAASRGTGHIKAALNYAMSLFNISEAHELGYDENVYLDSATHTYVEETGGANILFVTKDGTIVTPKSDTILPSITRRSLLVLAKDYLGIKAEERRIDIKEIKEFKECALCGTASVLSPVGSIDNHGDITRFEPIGKDSVMAKLRELLLSIQYCDTKAPEGWIYEIK